MENTSEERWVSRVKTTCEDKHGVREHEVRGPFAYEHIQDSPRPYATYCALGQPFQKSDNKNVYRIHCIS